jgi:pimeloyl-ACP methyl ester carboxylesterase
MSADALSVHRVPAVGAASGPSVVLIHGFSSRGRVDWPDRDWARPLAAAGRPVIVVDLPGHGASAPLREPLPTSDALRMLASVLPPEPVDVVAYSLGARLAWDLASLPGVAVRRMVLGGLSPVEPFGAVDLAAARDALTGGPAPADPLTGMILSMARLPGNDPASLLNVVEGFAAEPFDPGAAPPRIPVLLLGGADDPMAAGIDGLAALVPGASIGRVPGDHVAALHSAEFRAAAERFLLD